MADVHDRQTRSRNMAAIKGKDTKKEGSMPNSKNSKRNYKKEYNNYHASPEQKKNRASRNSARAKMIKAGKASIGDSKDVAHRNGNPRSNKSSNLTVQTKKQNRSYPRTKTARKKNPKS